MAFNKGHKKKGGRVKGTPNKRTEALEAIFAKYQVNPAEELLKVLPTLDDKLRVEVLLNLMQYLYPKRKAIEHSFNPAELEDGALIEEARLALAHFEAKGKP